MGSLVGLRRGAATRGAARWATRRASAPPPVFGATDHVLTYDSAGGAFRIHYTAQGPHAVPAHDADADGVPDYVRTTADEYDRVLDFYVSELGFQPPRDDALVEDDHGGDGRFDVYLLDFPTRADGAYRSEACTATPPRRCAGYMLQENDFDRRSVHRRAGAHGSAVGRRVTGPIRRIALCIGTPAQAAAGCAS